MKKRIRRATSDPKGFIVLGEPPIGGFLVAWCRSDSGAKKSSANMGDCGFKAHIIPVSDLLAWVSSGVDELESLYKL